ncbi:MAG: methylated-DNA--[protein]-cysteine S-methyltransferase [Saprospiraceae bacterium]|nr:methylated-DNA--[protein]-cysteine S-methyltransferase [Saprospiraceae bacterium]
MVNHHYSTIEKAIEFIRSHFKEQPSLEDIAKHVHVSPSHFQKIFGEWAGVSPKSFLSHVSVNYAKFLLRERQLSLFDTAMETGLSGTGRLHDLFVTIEGMTPGEYKNKGQSLTICYNLYQTVFGSVIIASTDKGICYVHFYENETKAIQSLFEEFPEAKILKKSNPAHINVVDILQGLPTKNKITLHVKGSPFRLQVWKALLSIPEGQLTTYQNISSKINLPKASRAVGSAIGDNPVAFLIPCHRVIRTDGDPGGYMWGLNRKTAMICWEQIRRKP